MSTARRQGTNQGFISDVPIYTSPILSAPKLYTTTSVPCSVSTPETPDAAAYYRPIWIRCRRDATLSDKAVVARWIMWILGGGVSGML